MPKNGLRIQTLLKATGELELSLQEVPLVAPAPGEVLVRVEATPINPSDLGQLFGAADMDTVRQSGTTSRPVITATVPPSILPALSARVNLPMGAGNEGAGTVVAAGAAPEAQALLGRTVATFAGEMYAQFRTVPAAQCMPLPDGVSARDGAACFVNPLTALGMVETMRRDGHTALVHTAAASNLGQMLNRICIEDGVGLVNIVRSPAQERLLRSQGAKHVCNSASPTFTADLTEAIAATGATIAFDAIGGGSLCGQILAVMENVLARGSGGYSLYGTQANKQVCIYGGLDPSPIVLRRNYGANWSVSDWLLPVFLRKAGPETLSRLQRRVAAGLQTTFSSRYAKEVSLAGALQATEIAVYRRIATGEKYLISPQLEDTP
jgi:NADPH2:quinone reductase